jgi:hypothetical protein
MATINLKDDKGQKQKEAKSNNGKKQLTFM